MKTTKLKQLAEELGLEVVRQASDFESKEIGNSEVNRIGLQLAGYLEGFPYRRLQIVGGLETQYYMSMDEDIRYERFKNILSYPVPAIIFTRGKDIPAQVLEMAEYHNKTILRSHDITSKLISTLMDTLAIHLAEEVTMHAELLEVYGMGVLITGDSSVGKSETALDLVTRGHRLVADDVVDIIKVDQELVGSCPENIRHFLEIRGLGILDIQSLYGLGSIKTSAHIDLVIHLEPWDDEVEYDRLGLDQEYTEILGIKKPLIKVPVKQGRNLAMIVEVATRNTRQRFLGYNAAEELNRRLIEGMKNQS